MKPGRIQCNRPFDREVLIFYSLPLLPQADQSGQLVLLLHQAGQSLGTIFYSLQLLCLAYQDVAGGLVCDMTAFRMLEDQFNK